MKRLSWKYLAGLVDGEGCLDFQIIPVKKGEDGHLADRRYIRARVRITFAEPSRFLLENIQNNFGGHLDTRQTAHPNVWQNAVTWSLCGKRALGFLQNIKGHLILKKHQADFLYAFTKDFSSMRFGEPATGQKFRQMLADELKAMKRDPHRLSEPAHILRMCEATVDPTIEAAHG